MFNGVKPGDLIFTGDLPACEGADDAEGQVKQANASSFGEAVTLAGGAKGGSNGGKGGISGANHCSIITAIDADCADCSVVHATSKVGVIEEKMSNYCKRHSAAALEAGLGTESLLTFTKVKNATPDSLKDVIEWARSKISCSYNDIFSPNCRDSHGNEAYYCCQLVRFAFQSTAIGAIFPTRKMQFGDGDSEDILPYWKKYFEERGCEVPLGCEGSHPSALLKCDAVEPLFSVKWDGTQFALRIEK